MPPGGGDASQLLDKPLLSGGGALVSVAVPGLSKPSGFLSDVLLFQVPAAILVFNSAFEGRTFALMRV